jgi:DNA-binding CsgD family transcriptional regulator
MQRIILLFAGLILGILLLFQLSKYALFNSDIQQESILGLIAIFFFGLGIFLNRRQVSKSVQKGNRHVDYRKVKAFQISSREYEVLEALAEKLTNKQIAAKLFLSESTIKSHVSNLFQKLGANSREEAVSLAIEHQLLIPEQSIR